MAVRRNNKAKKDKDSILADVKNLLYILHPAIQKMPKIERMEGAPREMKMACYNMIRHFNTAKECPEVRLDNIRAMFGEYGVLMATFDLCVEWGLLTDSDSFRIAVQLEKIKVRTANASSLKLSHLDNFVSSINSYTGFLKLRTDYGRIRRLRAMISPEWWNYLSWDERRLCVCYRPGFTPKERIKQKYNLKTHKKHGKPSKRPRSGAQQPNQSAA